MVPGADQVWFEIDDSKSWLADWGFEAQTGNVMQHRTCSFVPDLREVPMQGTMSLDSAYNSGTDAMSVECTKECRSADFSTPSKTRSLTPENVLVLPRRTLAFELATDWGS
jgi:hypothetical protein